VIPAAAPLQFQAAICLMMEPQKRLGITVADPLQPVLRKEMADAALQEIPIESLEHIERRRRQFPSPLRVARRPVWSSTMRSFVNFQYTGCMAFLKLGSMRELPEGSMLEVNLGANCYALCNVEGEVHAIDGLCLHRGGPLAQGALHGTKVVCPWHAW